MGRSHWGEHTHTVVIGRVRHWSSTPCYGPRATTPLLKHTPGQDYSSDLDRPSYLSQPRPSRPDPVTPLGSKVVSLVDLGQVHGYSDCILTRVDHGFLSIHCPPSPSHNYISRGNYHFPSCPFKLDNMWTGQSYCQSMYCTPATTGLATQPACSPAASSATLA